MVAGELCGSTPVCSSPTATKKAPKPGRTVQGTAAKMKPCGRIMPTQMTALSASITTPATT